jgi:hypothetical protein
MDRPLKLDSAIFDALLNADLREDVTIVVCDDPRDSSAALFISVVGPVRVAAIKGSYEEPLENYVLRIVGLSK